MLQSTVKKRGRKDNIMYTDSQVLQVIYLAIVRYFAARRQQKQEARADEGRATYHQKSTASTSTASGVAHLPPAVTSVEPV